MVVVYQSKETAADDDPYRYIFFASDVVVDKT